jgi:hypothetical protein
MAFLDSIGLRRGIRPFILSDVGVKSTWAAEGNLQSVVWSEALGDDVFDNLPLLRADAISIPAVSKGRNLLVSTIAKWNLVGRRFDRATGVDEDTTSQHPWLYRTRGPVSPYSRMVWTIDDGVFYGCSLWQVERASADGSGRRRIVEAEWVPFNWWDIRDGGFVLYEGGDRTQARRLSPDEYIFFDFPFEGLLNISNRTLRGLIAQEDAWTGRARNPIPLINLKRTEDYELGPEDRRRLAHIHDEGRRT